MFLYFTLQKREVELLADVGCIEILLFKTFKIMTNIYLCIFVAVTKNNIGTHSRRIVAKQGARPHVT